MTEISQSNPPARQHFDILDGLRGIAALAIVIFHFMEMAFPRQDFHLGHSYLAVDFFFCLSGFVIAYAYDERLPSMGLKNFFIRRLIRLHPLVILGAALGLVTFIFDPFSTASQNYSLGAIALFFLTAGLLIPYPMMEERAFNVSSLNAPSWSLFWEYIANIAYALVLRKFSIKMLTLLVIVSGVLLFSTSHQAGNLLGGWSGETFWQGGARLTFSFSLGLLIYRLGWTIKNKLGFPILALLLLATLMVPCHESTDRIVDPLICCVAFPLLIMLGAGATTSKWTQSLCKLSGELSYPIYMTHYAVIWVFYGWITQEKPTPDEILTVTAIGVPVMIAFAYFWLKIFDAPIRRALTRMHLKNAASTK